MADVVLGIETSCDETSAAVLVNERRGPELASLVILSQDVHRVFGGVVPELASRAHVEARVATASTMASAAMTRAVASRGTAVPARRRRAMCCRRRRRTKNRWCATP